MARRAACRVKAGVGRESRANLPQTGTKVLSSRFAAGSPTIARETPMPRSTARFIPSSFALFALAACVAQPAPAPPPHAAVPSAPPPTVAAPASSDQDFVNRAVAGTAVEVETGRLARVQAASPAVSPFGGHIAQEHTRLNAQGLSPGPRER